MDEAIPDEVVFCSVSFSDKKKLTREISNMFFKVDAVINPAVKCELINTNRMQSSNKPDLF